MNLGKRCLLAFIAAGAIAGAAGCDAAGGIDLEKAVRTGIAAESKESKISAAWKIKMDEGEESANPLLALVRTGRLDMDVKRESWRTMSAEGTLTLESGALPFLLYQDGDMAVLDVEGMKVPQKADVRSLIHERSDWQMSGFGLGDLIVPTDEGNGAPPYIALAAFLAEHIPNPERTKVSRVSEAIGDGERELVNITFEAEGEEALHLARAAVNGMIRDEEGLKELVSSIYDGLKPALEKKLEERPDDLLLNMALSNKDLAVTYVTGQLSKRLSETAAKWGSMEAGEDALRFSLSWLLDGDVLVGSDAALEIPLASGQRFELVMSERKLRVNEEVKAKTYRGDTGEPFMKRKPRERLSDVETDSLLYDILKHQLRITTASFKMYMGENAKVPDGVSPYIKGTGTTMVPVRYVSEQLDAAVHWDQETSVITITDEAEGIEIVMQIGSRIALVNGEEKELSEAPEIIFQTTFVPIAFITNALNGEARWDPVNRTVTITKEF